MKNYIPTIGLEIHAELKTQSKMFCSCRNDPDEKRPNVNICPICLGHPGTLPVLNKQAIRHVLLVGHAVGGKIADYTEWDRKNYFYPDIPKGYQISQYKYPLISGGAIPVSVRSEISDRKVESLKSKVESLEKRDFRLGTFDSGLISIAITRIHLEEDTAKSTHGQGKSADESLVDFNRAGVPLLELVTEPVIHDAETAGSFAREFQLLLRTLGVAEANMEKGEMRVEANVSVASEKDTADGKFGTKTEVKNLNSFRSVEHAIAFEINRQIELLEKGEKVVQETRGWDENTGETFSQRAKESSHDYRYFPDPDLPKLVISEIKEFSPSNIKKDIPELPWDKRARYRKDYGMTAKEAEIFVVSAIGLTDYYEAVIEPFGDDMKRIKLATNYIANDYLYSMYLGDKMLGEINEVYNVNKITPNSFTELISLIAGGTLSSRGAKDLIGIVFKENPSIKDSFAGSFKDLAKKHNLIQKSDASELESMVKEIIAKNPAVVADYKAGKLVALQFLIGQGMKLSKGSANPEVLREVFLKQLK
jgi:aspartyl-tRNA(Asn)/glutamyl-tRNA(Gln) amidotransferase subunit B